VGSQANAGYLASEHRCMHVVTAPQLDSVVFNTGHSMAVTFKDGVILGAYLEPYMPWALSFLADTKAQVLIPERRLAPTSPTELRTSSREYTTQSGAAAPAPQQTPRPLPISSNTSLDSSRCTAASLP
jgi:hypothetical protein